MEFGANLSAKNKKYSEKGRLVAEDEWGELAEGEMSFLELATAKAKPGSMPAYHS
jgi:hypothetical protein